MEELQKFQAVAQCETFEELINVVEQLESVQGSQSEFASDKIIEAIKRVQNASSIDYTSFYGKSDSFGYSLFNYVTRTYGLRAKTIYLKLYAKDRNI